MKLHKSEFARNVVTLMTGTSIAQAIPIAISPILTRLYSPEEFGLFALYMAISSIAAVLVTGRYELAIIVPKKDEDAINIVALSIFLSLIISAIIFVIVLVFNQEISTLLNTAEISNWLYFIPVTTLIIGVYQSLNYWSNRKGHYKRMALSRVIQSGSTSTVQLSAAPMAIASAGLVVGQLVGQVLSTTQLGWLVYRDDNHFINKVKKTRMIALARKYVNFPKFLVLAHGFNIGSSQMPIILMGSFFGAGVAGFYMLTQRVLGAPTTIIAGAIGDVFRQEASKAYTHYGSCKEIYLKAFKRLLIISFLPFMLAFFIAPDFFSLVFGENWRISGVYAQVLMPMFFLRFITSPLSSMFIIAQAQKVDLAWQVGLFFLVVISFVIGQLFFDSYTSILLFSTSYCIMYLINGLISYRLACGLKVYR